MADTTTSNYGLVKPEVGASNDTWGTKTNGNWDVLDTTVKAVSNVANAAMPKAGGIFTGAVTMQAAIGNPNFLLLDNTANAGAGGKAWRIGDTGASATGNFSIYNATGAITPFVIAAAGNATFNYALNVAGALTQNGQQVWHAGNLTPGNYALLSGAAFSGNVAAPAFLSSTAFPNLAFTPTGWGSTMYLEAGVAANGTGAGDYARIAVPATKGVVLAAGGSQPLIATGSGVAVTGTLTQNGNQVWHAGNLTPGNYAALAGATFTGTVQSNAPYATPGSANTYAFFANQGGANGVSVGNDATNAYVQSWGGRPLVLNNQGNSITLAQATTASSTLNVLGALTQSGNQVWHAGNLTPSSYAALAGATFSGTVSAPSLSLIGGVGVPNYVLLNNTANAGGKIWRAGDTGSAATGNFSIYNQTDNQTPLTITPAGAATFLSSVTAGGAINRDANFGLNLVSSNSRVTFDSGDYVEFDRTANKYTFYIGSTARFSIDSAGNIKSSGNITGSTTP